MGKSTAAWLSQDLAYNKNNVVEHHKNWRNVLFSGDDDILHNVMWDVLDYISVCCY